MSVTSTHRPLAAAGDSTEGGTARRRLLEIAAHRFVAQGYAATTLRQVAADAGIKAGSIYHHFDSKQQIFAAVLEDGIRVMEDAFSGAAAAAAASRALAAPTLRLRTHVRAHLGALFEHGPFTAAHVTAFFTAPEDVRASAVVHRDRYEHAWNGLFADLFPDLGAQRGQLLRLLLFGSMNSTIEWFDPHGGVSLDELADLVTTQFLNGIEVPA